MKRIDLIHPPPSGRGQLGLAHVATTNSLIQQELGLNSLEMPSRGLAQCSSGTKETVAEASLSPSVPVKSLQGALLVAEGRRPHGQLDDESNRGQPLSE